jgi:ribonucleotide reductase beta subunit family protein with ferritin-like domain
MKTFYENFILKEQPGNFYLKKYLQPTLCNCLTGSLQHHANQFSSTVQATEDENLNNFQSSIQGSNRDKVMHTYLLYNKMLTV